jgi:hypothetical protein
LRSTHNSKNVFLGQQDVLVAAKLAICTGVFAVQNLVADADFMSRTASIVVGIARTQLDNLAHLRLFFGSIGKKDAACSLLFGFRDFYEDAVSKRLNGGNAERNSCHRYLRSRDRALGAARSIDAS